MKSGDWFSAGGLSGTVVSLSRDDLPIESASAGMGVKLRINIKVLYSTIIYNLTM